MNPARASAPRRNAASRQDAGIDRPAAAPRGAARPPRRAWVRTERVPRLCAAEWRFFFSSSGSSQPAACPQIQIHLPVCPAIAAPSQPRPRLALPAGDAAAANETNARRRHRPHTFRTQTRPTREDRDVDRSRIRTAALSRRLALASLGTAIAVGVVCAVGLSSLENTAAVARVAVTQQLALIDDAAAMSAFQYQKGFVAEYLLTGNRAWLAELETSRPAFESWLARAPREGRPTRRPRTLLDDIQREYAAYDRARKTAIALYDAGKADEARAALEGNHARDRSACAICFTSSDGWRGRTPSGRWRTPSGTSAGSPTCSWEPASRARSPACSPDSSGRGGSRSRSTSSRCRSSRRRSGRASRSRPGAPGSRRSAIRSSALVEKLEETDAALAEHRRRLMQSEKLSAVGELAAKLAHEVLNPLAGMKAAVQLLARQGRRRPAGARGGRDRRGAEPRDHAGRGAGPAAGQFLAAARAARRGRDGRRAARRGAGGRAAGAEAPRRDGRARARTGDLRRSRSTRCCSRRCSSTCSSNAAEAMAPSGGRVELTRAPHPAARPRRDRDPRRRPGARDPGGAPRRAVQAVLHDQAGGPRPGPRGQPEHPARARRPDRRRRTARPKKGRGAAFEVQLPVRCDERPGPGRRRRGADPAVAPHDARPGGLRRDRRRVGQRGLAPLPGGPAGRRAARPGARRRRRHRPPAPHAPGGAGHEGHPDLRARIDRERGRGDEARRLRLHQEAVRARGDRRRRPQRRPDPTPSSSGSPTWRRRSASAPTAPPSSTRRRAWRRCCARCR